MLQKVPIFLLDFCLKDLLVTKVAVLYGILLNLLGDLLGKVLFKRLLFLLHSF